jgi:formamidase
MSGLGGLNKAPDGVVIGLVQLQLPTIATPADLAAHDQSHLIMRGSTCCRGQH